MCACWLIRSMTMKSLPRPCILVKRRSIVRASGRQQAFAGVELLHTFAAAHFESLVTVHQRLGGANASVVVGPHDEAVGSSRTHGQQVTFGQGQLAILGEEIPGFADRSDDIVRATFALARLH